MKQCIGLFGTCGKSEWRNSFIKKYEELNIAFFNPQVKDWKPELAIIEANHLAEDAIILFPITNETYGTGSLAETGFSVLNAARMDAKRDFVIMIDMVLKPELMIENPSMAKDSIRARALVSEHLKRINISGLYIVPTLEDMLRVSLTLWKIAELRRSLE